MKIYKTKKGQPYIIDKKTGRAKFIKRSATKTIKRKSYNVKRTKIKTRGYKTMAKRKSYRKAKSMGMFGKLNKPIMGAAGVVAYESFISPMIPLQGVAKDMLELVGGLYLSKKSGILGATGQSLVVINSYQLMSGLVGNKLQGLLNTNTTSAYNYA